MALYGIRRFAAHRPRILTRRLCVALWLGFVVAWLGPAISISAADGGQFARYADGVVYLDEGAVVEPIDDEYSDVDDDFVGPLPSDLDLPPGVDPVYLDEELPYLKDDTYGFKPQFMVPYPGFSDHCTDCVGCGDVCSECEPGRPCGGFGCPIGGVSCPLCRSGCSPSGCQPSGSYSGCSQCNPCGSCNPCAQRFPRRGCYAAVDLMMLRVHVPEDAFVNGKYSEQYQFSPRLTVIVDDIQGFAGRARYWHYDHRTPVLGAGGVQFQFDVLDLEVIGRMQSRRTDLILGAGVRLAGVDIGGLFPHSDLDALGVTFSADARTMLCCNLLDEWAWIYGARLSLLGGDWHGALTTHDDNVFVQELYVGIDKRRRFRNFDLDLALLVETQNWRSDAFVQNDLGTSSIGLIGPVFKVGVGF